MLDWGQKRIFLTGVRARQKVRRAGGRGAEQLLGKKKPVEKVIETISIWLWAAVNTRVVPAVDVLAVAEVRAQEGVRLRDWRAGRKPEYERTTKTGGGSVGGGWLRRVSLIRWVRRTAKL